MTGAAGFIGSNLAEAIASGGNRVIGVDRFSDYYSKNIKLSNLSRLARVRRFRLVTEDLATSNLSSILKGVDYVFHLAAQPGVRSSWGNNFDYYVRDNIIATQRLLEAAKKSRIKKFVFASSSSVYGDAEKMPTSESSTPLPNSPYGATKVACENLCEVYFKNHGVPTVCLRYFTVYGPRQRPDMAFHKFIDAILNGRNLEVYGSGAQSRDFTHVNDIVRGTMMSVNAEPGSTYNLASGKTVSLISAIKLIEECVGKDARIVMRGTETGDVLATSADISRALKDLGYKPKLSLAEGMRTQVQWHLSKSNQDP